MVLWVFEELRTSVDDLFAVKISETMENTFGHFAEDFLANPATKPLHLSIDAVEATAFAELHRNRDGT